MALEGLRGFDSDQDITTARGTDVGLGDYIFDIPVVVDGTDHQSL